MSTRIQCADVVCVACSCVFVLCVLSYEGEWRYFEDVGKKRHGFGRFAGGGESYSGQWLNGALHGKGRYTFASGATYDGEWRDNKFFGRGTCTWPAANGQGQAMYIGDWVENKMHGVGSFLATTGDRYEGVFHNDRFQNAQGHWIAPCQKRKRMLLRSNRIRTNHWSSSYTCQTFSRSLNRIPRCCGWRNLRRQSRSPAHACGQEWCMRR